MNSSTIVRRVILAIIFASCSVHPAFSSVSAKRVDKDPLGWASLVITISGRIDKKTADDFAKIAAPVTNTRYFTSDSSRGSVLVSLENSDGGVVTEALKIADIVRENRFSTFVAKNEHCISACALIFLAGKRAIYEMGEWPDRNLEIGGVVGFHSPYDAKDNDEPGLFVQGVSVVRQIFRTLGDAFPPDLFVETAVIPPTKIKQIDTVYDALRWKINLVGYKDPPAGRESLLNACENFFDFKDVRPISALEPQSMPPKPTSILKDGDGERVIDSRGRSIRASNYILSPENDKLIADIRNDESAPDFMKDIRQKGAYASQFAWTHEDEGFTFWCSAYHYKDSDQTTIIPHRIALSKFLEDASKVEVKDRADVPFWYQYPPGTKLSAIKK
jgi:hypothetical protein